jgi:hypothetical protein
MTRVRARWITGLGLVISGAAAISCGSGDSAGLFSMSSAGAGTDLGLSGASMNQAGANNVAGDEGGGAFNQSGGGSDQTSGAPGAGMTSTEGGGSGSAAGGSMGSAGKGGSTGKAGSGGGGAGAGAGAGGKAGAGGSAGTAGMAGASAGAGGAVAGAGGSGGSSGGGGSGGISGGGGAGPVLCSDNAGCSESQYCAKPDCTLGATGTCAARPIDCSGTAEAAMCGCDGFTYHDACLMHLNGENSLAAGACNRLLASTVTCSAANDATCKGGACGFKADTACPGTLPVKGICWVLPATCPSGGGTAKAAEVCNPVAQGPNSFCASECTAVKTQVRYALTAMCN